MKVTKETVIDALRAAVPEFKIDGEWAEQRLDYVIINDLARYICHEADFEHYLNETEIASEQVQRSLDFLEMALAGGDPYVRDLVHESLESLASCDRVSEIKSKFGPLVLGLWQQLRQ